MCDYQGVAEKCQMTWTFDFQMRKCSSMHFTINGLNVYELEMYLLIEGGITVDSIETGNRYLPFLPAIHRITAGNNTLIAKCQHRNEQ